jgi:hypothetical protein
LRARARAANASALRLPRHWRGASRTFLLCTFRCLFGFLVQRGSSCAVLAALGTRALLDVRGWFPRQVRSEGTPCAALRCPGIDCNNTGVLPDALYACCCDMALSVSG